MTDAEFAGMVDGILACVRHDPDIETKGAEAVAREHILSGLHSAHAEGLEAGAKERNDLRSKLEGMARSRDKWQQKYEAFTQAAGMKPLRVAYLALLDAVRLALHTLQDPMRGFVKRCTYDRPHDHKDLQTVRAAMALLQKAFDEAADTIQPRSLIPAAPEVKGG